MDVVDNDILRRLISGDPEAFRNLFDRIYTPLVQHAAFYLMDIAVAEDIVQDALTGVWDNRRNLGKVDNFEGYMLRSVRNRCLNHLKHAKINNQYRQKQMIREVSEVDTDPETYYKAIYELIGRMPEKRRQVFKLSVFQGMTYAQIAETAGISINTVKDHIKAAYAFLRKESAHIPYP